MGELELACPTAFACLCKVRPGVLSKTLSHMWVYLWWWIHRDTSRTFGERFKEHLKDPSPIYHHCNNTGHPISQNNFQIIGREGHGLARNIKKSSIRLNNPTSNRNIGKFNLRHIWDRVLLNPFIMVTCIYWTHPQYCQFSIQWTIFFQTYLQVYMMIISICRVIQSNLCLSMTMYKCYIHPNNPISVFFYWLKSSFVWYSSKHSAILKLWRGCVPSVVS